MDTQARYCIVEITPGGVTGYHVPTPSLPRRARTHTSSHRAVDEFLAALEEDGVILDSRDAIDRSFALVVRSPYLDPSLEPGTIANIHGLPRPALDAVAHGFWGRDAELMLDTSAEFPFTGFDTVSVDLYVTFWHAHGARVGRRTRGGEIVWSESASRLVAA